MKSHKCSGGEKRTEAGKGIALQKSAIGKRELANHDGVLMIKTKHINYQVYKISNVAFGENVRFNCCGLPCFVTEFLLVAMYFLF